MEQLWAALDGAWRVLVVGVLLGAGLPALFAVGVRSMAWGSGGDAALSGSGTSEAHPLGKVIAWVMFTLVVLVVLAGITYIVLHGLGYTVTFNGLIPVVTPKH